VADRAQRELSLLLFPPVRAPAGRAPAGPGPRRREPYNLATAHGIWECRRRGIPALFFTWQNLNRRYPLPFRLMERYVYRASAWAVAGTPAAANVLQAKGYR